VAVATTRRLLNANGNVGNKPDIPTGGPNAGNTPEIPAGGSSSQAGNGNPNAGGPGGVQGTGNDTSKPSDGADKRKANRWVRA
jgi:hypothetical protein